MRGWADRSIWAGFVAFGLCATPANGAQAQVFGTDQNNDPLCAPSYVPDDTSGWGWQDTNSNGSPNSCIVQHSYGHSSAFGNPYCSPDYVDSDNDGWGWQDTNNDGNAQSCVVDPNGAELDYTDYWGNRNLDGLPYCSHDYMDINNDGQGVQETNFLFNKVCVVSSPQHAWGIDAYYATPYCSPDYDDTDNDGWGWQDTDGVGGANSCVVQAAPPTHAYGIDSATGAPYCSPSYSGSDVNGWGWEDTDSHDGPNSCVIQATPRAHRWGEDSFYGSPYCSPDYDDTDNDGWGWMDTNLDGSANSCVVQASSTHFWGYSDEHGKPYCSPGYNGDDTAGFGWQDTNGDGTAVSCVIQRIPGNTTAPFQSCINLGNALEASVEGDWGYYIEDSHIADIAAEGFDAVRIPVKWSAHAGTSAPYTLSTAIFDRVDHVVDEALAEGLYVILDVHHYTELMDDPSGHEARVDAIVDQIADHYADYSDKLILELVNEPNGAMTYDLVNDMNVRLLDIVRDSNPDRWVVLSSGSWSNIDGLEAVSVPDDTRIMATVHMYTPFDFTHQGAAWTDQSATGVTWGGTADEAEVTGELQRAADFASDNNIPVFVGEFGVYEEAAQAERVQWTRYVREESERLGMSWCAWDLAGAFPIYDTSMQTFDSQLSDALLD
jgi:endoglucanase